MKIILSLTLISYLLLSVFNCIDCSFSKCQQSSSICQIEKKETPKNIDLLNFDNFHIPHLPKHSNVIHSQDNKIALKGSGIKLLNFFAEKKTLRQKNMIREIFKPPILFS